MIQEMIEKLVADAQKEASHKAFCDKEMSETNAKLKEEIATLQSELAAIAKAQKEADAMRAEEAAAWAEAKADYESGVEGVGMALQVLRDYYAEKDEAFVQTTHEKATGVKYKTKDQKETENALAGLKEDREGTQKELDAILEYWDKLQPMCVAKPESYAERKKRREAEIAGLKEALRILEEESGSAFLQIRSIRRA